jgi:hypothetical protein
MDARRNRGSVWRRDPDSDTDANSNTYTNADACAR